MQISRPQALRDSAKSVVGCGRLMLGDSDAAPSAVALGSSGLAISKTPLRPEMPASVRWIPLEGF